MEVRQDPPLIIHALRVGSDAPVVAESHVADRFVLDRRTEHSVDVQAKQAGAFAGFNGDFYAWAGGKAGDMVGIQVRNGELVSAPTRESSRSSAFGWGPRDREISLTGWSASFQVERRNELPIDGLNEAHQPGETILFTSSSGWAVADEPATFAVLATGANILEPDSELEGELVAVYTDQTRRMVRPGTAVLVADGDRADVLSRNVGQEVVVRVSAFGFDWDDVTSVMAGWPILLDEGNPIQDRPEAPRHPRTAVGVTEEGDTWYVVVDGRQPMSVGVTFGELAAIMSELGCVDALNLDGGGSSTFYLLGQVLNRPSDGQPRTVANSILLFSSANELLPPQAEAEPLYRIEPQGALVGGETTQLRLLAADGSAIRPEDVIWSAAGAAWVEQDGTLHVLEPGEAVVRARFGAFLVERTLLVD
jgi:hypothetical protein